MAFAPRKASTEFELCPAGPQRLVCCDVIDLGQENTAFSNQAPKMMHKVRLRFQTAAKDSKGKPYIVQRKFTWSMHEKAALRKFIQGWIGREMTTAEADQFDFDQIIGWNGLAPITHNTKKNGTYADIGEIMALYPGMEPITVSPDYVREPPLAERMAQQAQATPPPAPQQPSYPHQQYPQQPPQAAPVAPPPGWPQPQPVYPPVQHQNPYPGQMAPPAQPQPQPGQMAPGWPQQPQPGQMAPAPRTAPPSPAPVPQPPAGEGFPSYAPHSQPPAAHGPQTQRSLPTEGPAQVEEDDLPF